jgi:ATP-dependent RNA helicase DDX6/DHH1
VHVIVATPGRILDLSAKGVADLKNCKMVVLDEVDKLLSVDFKSLVEQLMAFLPKEK